MGSCPSTEVKVGVLQFKPEFMRIEENLNRIKSMVEKFDGDVLILPELTFSGYFFKDRKELFQASEKNEIVFEEMTNLARSKDLILVFGFVEKVNEKFYNSCALLLPNGRRFIYRKTHLFHREKLFFEPGDTGFFVVEFKGIRIGPAICFDWFFSESFRTLSLLGADLIAHCANLVMPYCQSASIYRAIENRVYIATANRWGKEERDGEEMEFTGMSQIVSPSGEILIRADEEGDVVISTLVDVDRSRNKMLNDFNDVLRDRRDEFYFKGKLYTGDGEGC